MSIPAPRAAWAFVLSQIGWFACVLGAAHGRLWLGPLTVGCIAVHFVWGADRRGRAALRLAAVAMAGLITDSVLMWDGALHFADAVQSVPAIPGPPAWMVALWVSFGTTLGGALHSLRRRRIAAAAVGAIFGALGYRAGVALGAAQLADPIGRSLGVVALAWAVVLPLLLWVDATLEGADGLPVRSVP